MSGIGNLMELISDISELFDEQSSIPMQRHTAASRKKSSVIGSKKENQKNNPSNDKIKSAEILRDGESILGNPPDHSSHIREKAEDDNIRLSAKKTQSVSIPYNLNYKNLKNAIVLSEILSPPLALRNRRFR